LEEIVNLYIAEFSYIENRLVRKSFWIDVWGSAYEDFFAPTAKTKLTLTDPYIRDYEPKYFREACSLSGKKWSANLFPSVSS
jgi:hypothetical protein